MAALRAGSTIPLVLTSEDTDGGGGGGGGGNGATNDARFVARELELELLLLFS